MLPTLTQARAWTEAGVQVTLLDPERFLYYSGMVPEHLGGVYDEAEIRIDLAARAQENGVSYVPDRAVRIAPQDRAVHTASGEAYGYEALAIDVGSVTPSVPAGATPTKPIASLHGLAPVLKETLASAAASLRIVVVGGGAAGVEIALNVSGRFQGAGRLSDLSLTVVEQADRLLPAFPEGLSQHAAERLRTRDVTVRTGTAVTSVDESTSAPTEVHTHDVAPLSADAVLWATGTVGPPVLQNGTLPTTNRGFLRTDRTLQVEPRIFAAGDCAAITGLDLARVGVHAVKQGPLLRANLHQTLRQLRTDGTLPGAEALRTFRPYPLTPLILSTGSTDGLWTAGSVWAAHPWLLRLKHWVDRRWIRTYAPEAWQHTTWRDHLGAESAVTADPQAGSVSSTKA